MDELNSLNCDPEDADLGYGDFVFSDLGTAASAPPCNFFNSTFSGSLSP